MIGGWGLRAICSPTAAGLAVSAGSKENHGSEGTGAHSRLTPHRPRVWGTGPRHGRSWRGLSVYASGWNTWEAAVSISDADRAHAQHVAAEMDALHAAMESLIRKIGDRRTIPHEEVEQLRLELAELKERLERGARYGTVDGAKRPQSPWESAYFAPAVSKAKAFLGIRSNSHPTTAGWVGQLTGAQLDIGMPLANLKAELGTE